MANVLIIDDESGIRIALRKMLEREGYRVEVAQDSVEALEKLQKNPYDTIISDVIMPKINGIELLQNIRQNFPHIPVILLTGEPTLESASQALRIGAFDYLTKPVSKENLCKTVASAIRLKSLQEENRQYQQDLERLVKERTEALSKSESLFRTVVESSKDAIIIIGEEDRISLFNPAAERMFEYSQVEIIGQPFLTLISPHEREQYRSNSFFDSTIFKPRPGATFQMEGMKKSEVVFPIEIWFSEGNYQNKRFIIAIVRDMSEYKRIQEQQEKLEMQIRQSQKLESIGSLAGGIAHDFNNLLSPILGYTEMVLMEMTPENPHYMFLIQVQRAAERAREFNKQLLAFSHDQILDIKTINLNQVIEGFQKILRTTIRENIQIDLHLDPDLWKVKADVSQIEQVLINLTVNSQDAIMDKGKLSIETRNVTFLSKEIQEHPDFTPGDYVCLEVKDNGIGMDEYVLQHIFEPFFTTKEKGKGTGLGMSTVYGIVKQHGGYITINSVVNEGTSVKIYFPRVKGRAETTETIFLCQPGKKGNETILVVEDDEMVRHVLCDILNRHGYRVLEAEDGEKCLKILEHFHDPVDLLLTDVVMTGINGRELYQKLTQRFSTLKVLYMSGYTGAVFKDIYKLEKARNFLRKPFSVQSLTQKIREVLG